MSSSQTRWKQKWCWVAEPSLVVCNIVHRVQPCAPSKEHRFVQEARMQGSAFRLYCVQQVAAELRCSRVP